MSRRARHQDLDDYEGLGFVSLTPLQSRIPIGAHRIGNDRDSDTMMKSWPTCWALAILVVVTHMSLIVALRTGLGIPAEFTSHVKLQSTV